MSEDCLPVLCGRFASEADLVDLGIYLPQNLSYAEESYLTTYGLTSNFVHSPKKERGFRISSELYHKKHVDVTADHAFMYEVMNSPGYSDTDSDSPVRGVSPGCPFDGKSGTEGTEPRSSSKLDTVTYTTDDEGCDVDLCDCNAERDRTFSLESAPSVSEEGIFDNDMESIDSGGKSSETNSIFSLEPIDSPEEESDLRKSNEGCEASIGELVCNAMQSIMLRDSSSTSYGETNASKSTSDNSNDSYDGSVSGKVKNADENSKRGCNDEKQQEITSSVVCNGESETIQEGNGSEHKGETSPGDGRRGEVSSPTSGGRKSPPRLKLSACEQLSFDQSSPGGSQRSILDLFDESNSPLYEEEEFNFNKAQLRKSSSLKTNKTPPGTPHRKKMVRFADALGLDLESVRHVLNADAPPKIPASAMKDLQVGIEEDRKAIGNRYLTAVFPQPGASDDFLQKVMGQKLCLENAVVTNLTITGVVRVANIGFHKFVRVRYTTNGWVTFHDIMASYIQNSCDGPTDRFSFSLVAPADFGLHSRLECAISYTVNDTTYWDNNDGLNYVFECFAKTTPTDPQDSWIHFV